MSYDINMKCPHCNREVLVEAFTEGGTYPVGGTNEAHLNITYNYSKHYYAHLDEEEGIRVLYGKTGKECLPLLEKAASKLKNDTHPDYWKPTEGNAKQPLLRLLTWCKKHPTAVFSGD